MRDPEIPTFTYTKLINSSNGEEDQPRVDFINTRPLPASIEKQVLVHLDNFADTFDVLFVSDQAETKQGGVVTPGGARPAVENCREQSGQGDLGGFARSGGAVPEDDFETE